MVLAISTPGFGAHLFLERIRRENARVIAAERRLNNPPKKDKSDSKQLQPSVYTGETPPAAAWPLGRPGACVGCGGEGGAVAVVRGYNVEHGALTFDTTTTDARIGLAHSHPHSHMSSPWTWRVTR